MRTHGWAGEAPTSDDEAVERILRAAGEIIDAGTAEPSIARVAQKVGVTRQTVYRYFDSTDALLQATAEFATTEFLTGLASSMRGITDPAAAVVEGIALTLERLRENPRFSLILAPESRGRFVSAVTSDTARSLGRSIIDGFDVDWVEHGWTSADLDELVEHMLRTVQSFIVDPGIPARTGIELRSYLWRWVAPLPRRTARSPIAAAE
ncbi:TetR/AcrR family transcriptional regulator [Aldersonia kunmingensis]|uniref:TetR/AcrR family transcriptional regulator n=1 Tax=Aldersonia kunmingensis TaxID=408066 RepID=UPI00082EC0EB|nr:TetR/AcrR family transcriptional regulator [Aldersonia kunmingensis]